MQTSRWQLQASTLSVPTAVQQLTTAKNILRIVVNERITEEKLRKHFARLGHAQHILQLVCLRAKNGPNALIHFRTEGDAIKAKKALQGSMLEGLVLKVQYGNRESFIYTGDGHIDKNAESKLWCPGSRNDLMPLPAGINYQTCTG